MAHGARGRILSDERTATKPAEYARRVSAVELPPTAREFVDRYDRVVGERDRFLWKWIHNLFEEFTLSCVPTRELPAVYERKTLLTIFVTVLDDLAESGDDRATFEVGRRIPFGAAVAGDGSEATGVDPRSVDDGVDSPVDDGVDSPVVRYLADLWDAIDVGIRNAPRHGEFVDVFEYDLRQTFNAMAYSGLLNANPMIANRAESERHDAYNMAMFPYACIDLMHSPSFDRSEFGALRSILCDLQLMARIGNWITTWERELAEGDISSGVVVCALRRDVVTHEEIVEAEPGDVTRLVDRIRSHGIESEFTREWEIRDRTVRKRTEELDSVDAERIVDGVEAVMSHHLASEGYK